MNLIKKPNNQNGEGGITLIALILMIIIIVIISAVTIRGLTGEHGLIDTTADVAQNYEIISYGEQINEIVHKTIIAYSSRGETPSIIDIADAINFEDWVKSAVPNEETNDIIVTVTRGYVYQVYYDSINGKVFVEYIGEDDESIDGWPEVTAHYEKSIASILAYPKDEVYGIAKLDLIYKEEIRGSIEKPKAEEKFDVSEIGKGWYKIKAISNSGRWRYAFVKVSNVSEKLKPPVIALSPVNPDGENDWYKGNVTVTISMGENPSAKRICYRVLEDGIETQERVEYNGTFPITKVGRTEIYAWVEDEKGYTSEESYASLKFDNVRPVITGSKIIDATKGAGTWIISRRKITSKCK